MLDLESAKLDRQEVAGKPAKGLAVLRSRPETNGRLRVAMIVGDNDTLHCGVKDSAYRLADALTDFDCEVDVLAPASWNQKAVWAFFRQLQKKKYDVLHVQYPSIGYRTSLIPHVLGLLRTCRAAVVSLHEFSALPRSQQLSTHVFRWSAGTLLFGSEYERSRFNQRLGLLGARQEFFPILSQVPCVPSLSGRDTTVVYFGQIRPKKGLEAYLELARHSVELGAPYQFHIMGSVPRAHQVYARTLQAEAPREIRWSFDLPFEDVGRVLGHSFAAYLPFPDGASERRGSLAAAWLNGLPVLSRIGEATTPAMRGLVVATRGADDALSALDNLKRRPDEYERISRASQRYAQSRTWKDVAEQHANIYRSLLDK